MVPIEARKQPRAQVALTPEYLGPADLDYVGARSVDVSAGGMFIESNRPIASGTLIKIRCEPRDTAGLSDGLIEGVAKVVWIRTQAAEGGPAGMGVKFVKLKGDSERVLKALVDGVVAAGGSLAPAQPTQPSQESDEGSAPVTAQSRAAVAKAHGSTQSTQSTPSAAVAPKVEARVEARVEAKKDPAPLAVETKAQTEATPERTTSDLVAGRRSRPSAADLAARLHSTKAQAVAEAVATSAPPVASGPPADAPAPLVTAAPTPALHPSVELADRVTDPVEVPRANGAVVFALGGLGIAIAVLALWLVLR